MIKNKTLLIPIASLLIFQILGMKKRETPEISANKQTQQLIAQRKKGHMLDLHKKISFLDAYINRVIHAPHNNNLQFPDYEIPTIHYNIPMEIGSKFFRSIHTSFSTNANPIKKHNPNLIVDTLEETDIPPETFLETIDDLEHKLCILQNGLHEADKLSLQKQRCFSLSKIIHFSETEKNDLCNQMEHDPQQFNAIAAPLGISDHKKFINHFDKLVSLREGLETGNALLINSCFKETTIKKVTINDYIAACIVLCKNLIEERDSKLYL